MKPAHILSLFLTLGAVTAFAAVPTAAPASNGSSPSPVPTPRVGPDYSIEMSRMIPMRDGVALEAWLFKPANLKGKAPTVLELTQYDIDGSRNQNFATFVRRGYVFAQVLVRGRGRSGGVKSDNLGLQVGRDGNDIVEWFSSFEGKEITI